MKGEILPCRAWPHRNLFYSILLLAFWAGMHICPVWFSSHWVLASTVGGPMRVHCCNHHTTAGPPVPSGRPCSMGRELSPSDRYLSISARLQHSDRGAFLGFPGLPCIGCRLRGTAHTGRCHVLGVILQFLTYLIKAVFLTIIQAF